MGLHTSREFSGKREKGRISTSFSMQEVAKMDEDQKKAIFDNFYKEKKQQKQDRRNRLKNQKKKGNQSR